MKNVHLGIVPEVDFWYETQGMCPVGKIVIMLWLDCCPWEKYFQRERKQVKGGSQFQALSTTFQRG